MDTDGVGFAGVLVDADAILCDGDMSVTPIELALTPEYHAEVDIDGEVRSIECVSGD